MNKRLRNIVVFITCTVLLVSIFDLFFTYSFKNNDFTKIWWSFNKKEQSYETAILGNSRPLTGISAELIEYKTGGKTINLAEADIAMNSYYLILSRFLEMQDNKIKRIVLNIDLPNLASEAKEDYDKIWNYIPYLAEDEVFEEVRRCYPIRAYLWKYIPLFGYAEFNSKIGPLTLLNSWTNLKQAAFNKYGDRSHDVETNLVPLKPKYDSLEISLDSPAMEYFKKIVALTAKNGIELYVITMPSYQHESTSYANKDEVLMEINSILKGHGQPLYLDLVNMIDTEDQTLFSDRMHLNVKGQLLFSSYLVSEVLNKEKE